jgi:hypothetical protein
MSFVKGMKKIEGSGMKKGSMTKRTAETAETFARIVEKYGDPLMALAEMAFNPEHDIVIRQSSLKEVVKYGHAQRKAVELSGPNGGALQLDHRLALIEQITGAVTKLSGK